MVVETDVVVGGAANIAGKPPAAPEVGGLGKLLRAAAAAYMP